MRGFNYFGIVGYLLYIAKQTRPDILATVSKLSRFLETPGKAHWVAAKRVLRYLKSTKNLELTFVRDEMGILLRGACDSHWASDVDDRRSTSGFAFILQTNGGAVSWSSKKQQTAAISTSEAEYQAMALAVQETLYLRSLLGEMGISCGSPTVIQEDNQSCIKMCENPVMHKRTKHIDVKYHFIRERVEDATIELQYCPTELMSADLLTKALTREKLERHRRRLMGSSLDFAEGSTA